MTPSADRQQFREVLAALAAKTLTRIPALNGRVEKACKLVLGGDVEMHPDGTALVNSLTDPTRTYQVTGSPATCQCKDFDHAPEHLCAHRLSVGFLRKVQELLPPAVESTPEVHPVSTSTLPEAPASVNVRLQVAGREVQWTLRDTDEARLAVRLEALLQRYPVPQASSPAPSQPLTQQQHNAAAMHKLVTGFCAVHNVQMIENEKNGQRWFSHRWPEGGFCKGR